MVPAAVGDDTFGEKIIPSSKGENCFLVRNFMQGMQSFNKCTLTFQLVSKVCFGLEDSVTGAPGFEGPGLLQILAFEKELETA